MGVVFRQTDRGLVDYRISIFVDSCLGYIIGIEAIEYDEDVLAARSEVARFRIRVFLVPFFALVDESITSIRCAP